MHVGLEGFVLPHSHHPLGGLYGEGRVARDLRGQLAHVTHQLRGRYDFAHDVQLQTLLRRECSPCEHDLAGLRPTDDARQEPRPTAFREYTAFGESGREFRFIRGDPDIASECQIHSVSRGTPVERADGRLVERMKHGWRSIAQVESAYGRADPFGRSDARSGRLIL